MPAKKRPASKWGDDYVPPSDNRPERWQAKEHVGELTVFIEPHPQEMETTFGDTVAAVCTAIIPLEGPAAGMSYSDENGVAVFGNLAKALNEYDGSAFALGVVNQGKAKPGRSAPFLLDDADPEQKAAAFAWMDDHLAKDDETGKVIVLVDEAAF